MNSSQITPEAGIIRMAADDGWYVKPIRSGVSLKPFYDVSYGKDPAASYAAALEYNAVLRPFAEPIQNVQVIRSNKARPELPVGITLATRVVKNRAGGYGQTLYIFKVSTFNGKAKSVYIGTQNTVDRNYDSKLETAIKLRERYRQQLLKPAALRQS